MPSSKPAANRLQRSYGKRTLQRLRREAGYRSAKDFAEVLHIPSSTYSRYERAIEGPECGIPMQAAWAMADELGCSIDLVVGRADIDEPETPTIDARVRKLGRSGREMLDDFLRYLEFREAANAAQDWR
jgi:transcriptional regulator with XRE-family HTH domain